MAMKCSLSGFWTVCLGLAIERKNNNDFPN